MKDGPLKDFWEECNGVEITNKTLDEWAEKAIEYANGSDYGYVRSGDSIVLAFKNSDEGAIEVFDCKVRRIARIKND